MSDWFSKAQKSFSSFTDSLVEQANVAQEQMTNEQQKVRNEAAQSKQLLEGDARLPWETDDDSLAILTQDVMEKILSLSLTEQNFTVSPPEIESFQFLFSDHIPTAMRLLSLDANLARMHAKLSPKMDEELFWQHYFFRLKYIRLKLGIEQPGSNNAYKAIKDLSEDDILYKPNFVPSPAPKTEAILKTPKPVSSSNNNGKKVPDKKSVSNTGPAEAEKDSSTEEQKEAEKERSIMECRRIAEAKLAAEVEAELDNDDIDLIDLGDLDLGDDGDDFDDLGGDDDDDDDELEAQIALELACETEEDTKA